MTSLIHSNGQKCIIMRYKFIYLLLAGLLAAGQVIPQTLVEGEYFLDGDDQGPGNGTPVTLSVTGGEIHDSITLNVTGLEVGFHWIHIRVKDADGKWSIARGTKFYVYEDASVSILPDQPEITGLEFFIDTDPGFGNGTWLTNETPGDTLENDYILNTDELLPGFHWLYSRPKDADGKWGQLMGEKFYVYEDTSINIIRPAVGIERAEYCFDTIKAVGEGTPLAITPGGEIDEMAQIGVTGLERGTHYLLIRVQDSAGVWSQAYAKEFSVVGLEIETNSPICQGSDDGWAKVVIEGGQPPFTYYWNDPEQQSDSVATGLSAGTYTVTVTDNVGALLKKSVTITEYDTIDITITTSDTECQLSEGSATAVAVSENGEIQYHWSNGSKLASATNLASGIYIVTVTDAAGCTNTGVAAINDIGGPVVSVVGILDVECAGESAGILDINVTGGTAPYDYLWSNGETSQDLINVPAGNYEVTVGDQQGCFAFLDTVIREPQPITFSISVTDASCGLEDGEATVTPSGGTPGYTFDWVDFSPPHDPTRTGLGAGVYKVTVTDANSCSADARVTVSEDGAPSINIISVTESTCGNTDGSVLISVSGITGTPVYEWTKDDIQVSSSEDLTGVGPGDYTVSVTDGGCSAYATATIPADLPATPAICLVTVDTVTNKNLIIWNKAAGQGILRYNIYRETTSAGQFEWIDSVPFDSLSYYVDDFADPAVRSWRYKISAVDACDVESRLSPPHKTMHLTINQGLAGSINLIWNHYEGFTPKDDQYRIWRWAGSTGWIQPDIPVPNNQNSWTDWYVPDEDVWYYVEAVHPAGCTPAKASTLNSTRSNRRNKQKGTGVEDRSFAGLYNLKIWPNPSMGEFTLTLEQLEQENLWIKVYDITGKLVYTDRFEDLYRQAEINLDLSGHGAGMYQLRLETGKGVYNRILVVQ